jgi:ribose-phosphate pyrophosphokinase
MLVTKLMSNGAGPTAIIPLQNEKLGVTRPFKIFAGSSNLPLAEKISAHLKKPLGKVSIKRFLDDECFCEIQENIRGHDVYIIQSTSNPVDRNLMEMLILGDAAKRASARSICAVTPYYGYSRQDRKSAPRTPITARLVADLITAAGFNRVISLDLHAGQIQGFFNLPFDHLFGSTVSYPYLSKKYAGEEVTIVSPDAGGTERARIMAKLFKAPLAIVDKRRSAPNEAQAMNLIGEVSGRVAIIVDDMIDTAGTLTEAARLLKENGSTQVVAVASHGIFSGPAYERMQAAHLDEIVVSDSIPLQDNFKKLKNLKVLTVGPLIAETIERIQRNDSVSALLDL